MKRTTVFADEDDLAVLKEAAARRGVAEAELIREAIHLVALSERRWTEPFFTGSWTAVDDREPNAIAAGVWDEKAAEHERGVRPA